MSTAQREDSGEYETLPEQDTPYAGQSPRTFVSVLDVKTLGLSFGLGNGELDSFLDSCGPAVIQCGAADIRN